MLGTISAGNPWPAKTSLRNPDGTIRAAARRSVRRTLVPERGPVTILSVEPGDIFGWSAVLSATQVQSTVVATEKSKALVIEGTKLRAALKEDHALAASLYPRVLIAVARRLRATRLQLLDLFVR